MRYLALAAVVTGLAAGLLWPGNPQPAQYAVYTTIQPHCAASEAGDLTTFVIHTPQGASRTFRAVCGHDGNFYYWDRLPNPADVKPVCGPSSNAETIYCPNVSDWRSW